MSNYDINWEQYFLPDHHWKLNEESGIAVPDSGKIPASDGVNNGPTDINRIGKVGKCYELDGTSSEYITVVNNGTFQLGFHFTFTAWIYMNSVAGAPRFISKSESAGGTSYDWWWQMAAGPKLHAGFVMEDATNVSYLSTGQTLVIGRWYFICVVFTGDLIHHYLDGEFDDSGISTPVPGKRPRDTAGRGFNICRLFSGVPDYYDFNGKIDDVRIYNEKALSASEIKQLYDYTNNYRNQALPIVHKPTHDKYTKVYCTFDGDLHDESEREHIVNPFDAAQLSNAQSKFGTESVYFDGTGSRLEIPDSEDWYFGTDDFTIDFWIYFNTLPSTSSWTNLITQRVDGTNMLQFFYDGRTANQGFAMDVYDSGLVIQVAATGNPVSTGQWYHVAYVRNGTNFRIYLDGLMVEEITDADLLPNLAAPLLIGRMSIANGTYFDGYLSDFRISKGIARWFSDFTPPTAPYVSTRYINLSRNRQDIVTQWPVHWWKLNETVGIDVINSGSAAVLGVNSNAGIAQEGYHQKKCYKFNGTSSYIDVGDTNTNIKSVGFWIYVNSLTEDIMDLDGGTHTIEVTNRTITATGFVSPTVYTDSVIASDLTIGWHHIFITTATAIDVNNLDIGKETNYLDGYMQDVQMYTEELSFSDVYRIYKYGLPTNALGDYCAKYYPTLLEKGQIKAVSQNRFTGAVLPEKLRSVDPDEALIIQPGSF